MEPLRLPLFPLASPVLFPGGVVPLHVFEPRYRQMTSDALAGARVIGMATVRPEAVEAMAGDPPLFAVGCAGVVHEARQLPDGRYHLVLHGTHRFRICEELPPEQGRLYRMARVDLLEERLDDRGRAERLRGAVLERMQALADRSAPDGEAVRFDAGRLAELDSASFANTVSQALGLPAPEKQGLLEADGIVERLERLESVLAFYLAAAGDAGGGSRRIH